MAVALGEEPADLLFKNGKVVNTFLAQVEEANVIIDQGLIAGVGHYQKGKQVIDLEGRFLAPGLIDGHVHLESSLLNPVEYAKAIVPRGVLAVVTDFHEIANVCGKAGIEYILDYSNHLPMDIFGMAPSCVPATHFETSGARLQPKDLKDLKNHQKIIGLGEMMNFAGLICGDEEVWKKVAHFGGHKKDGHAPGLTGLPLNAYLAAGIHSDHECTSIEEALEKLKRGMYIMLREGSTEKNLNDLLPMINYQTHRRCFFVVDDRSCTDLLRDGDVDAIVRKAIQKGLDPVWAIQMASINPAEYFRLDRMGAIAPGYCANLIVLDDLQSIRAIKVYYHGRLVAQDGELIVPMPKPIQPNFMNTINIKPFGPDAFRMRAKSLRMPVIEVIPDQIITRRVDTSIAIQDGFVLPDIEMDILKLVVVERHKATGHIGLGLVKGFGLKKGALASSIAHDSHNIISVGTNDHDMFYAIKELERLQGGLVVVHDGQVLGSLALPIAGLLSNEPLQDVVHQLEELNKMTTDLGSIPTDPFAVLSFLALPVIPELRLTDMGLVDVARFRLLD